MEDFSDFFELKLERNGFWKQLNNCRKQKKFIDVILKVGDRTFDAHRNVLSLHSPVLEAAISDRWSITTICPISEEYVDPEIVDDLLNFLYTGYIKLTPDNAHSVCVAAHFLQIPTLLDPSVEYLCKIITVENVFELFENSDQLELLHKRCLSFIISNYESLFQSHQILQFSFNCFNDVIVGLKEQFWGPQLRKRTFQCIIRWTEENPSQRLKHLNILLKNIPLVELSLKFLKKTVALHPLIKSSTSCQQTVSAAVKNFRPINYAKLYRYHT